MPDHLAGQMDGHARKTRMGEAKLGGFTVNVPRPQQRGTPVKKRELKSSSLPQVQCLVPTRVSPVRQTQRVIAVDAVRASPSSAHDVEAK